MKENNKLIIGVLTFLLITSGVVVTFRDDVRIEVERDATQFKVPREDMSWFWKLAGQEENRLFDGSSIMQRDLSGINISRRVNNETGEVWITRTTPYQRGPVVKDIYYFRGDAKDITLFPISHKVRVLNASDKFYRYTVDKLEGTGPKRTFENQTEFEFGNNMKVEVQEDYRWAWIGWPYGDNSFSAQYGIDSDNETFDVRLFDPPASQWWNDSYEIRYPHNDNSSGYDGLGYFGSDKKGWYGTIDESNSDVHTYNDTNGSLGFAVANKSDELCWFDTVNNETSCPKKTGIIENLTNYFPLDNNETYTKDFIGSKNMVPNGTLPTNVSGQVRNAQEFNGINDSVNTQISKNFGDYAFSMWVKPNNDSDMCFLCVSSGSVRDHIKQSSKEFQFDINGRTASAGTVNPNEWTHIIATREPAPNTPDSNVTIYVNGTNRDSTRDDSSFSAFGNYTIGKAGDNTRYLNGSVDDIRVYDYWINSTQAKNLYESSYDKKPFWGSVQDTGNLSVDLINPDDGFETSKNDVKFGSESEGFSSNISNSTLKIYNSSGLYYNETFLPNSSTPNNTITFNKSVNLDSVGGYNWSVTTILEDSSQQTAGNRSLTIASIPKIYSISPFDNKVFYNEGIVNFLVNVTDVVGGSLKNVSLKFDGSINKTNSSGKIGVYNFSHNFTKSGQKNWSAIAYSNEGFENETETRTFNLSFERKDFNISLNSNITFEFYPDNNTDKKVEPSGQNDTHGTFIGSNNLSTSIDIYAVLDQLYSGGGDIDFRIGNSSNYSKSTLITDNDTRIYQNLSQGNNLEFWSWADFNNTQQGYFPQLNITADEI